CYKTVLLLFFNIASGGEMLRNRRRKPTLEKTRWFCRSIFGTTNDSVTFHPWTIDILTLHFQFEFKRAIELRGGVPPFWASYLFHVKMTLLNAPGSWAT